MSTLSPLERLGLSRTDDYRHVFSHLHALASLHFGGAPFYLEHLQGNALMRTVNDDQSGASIKSESANNANRNVEIRLRGD